MMARKPRKARAEGAAAIQGSAAELVEAKEEPEESLTEEFQAEDSEAGRQFEEAIDQLTISASAKPLANPVPGDDGDALARIAASFQERFPEDWANIRLCPLQHGIPAMADILRGRG